MYENKSAAETRVVLLRSAEPRSGGALLIRVRKKAFAPDLTAFWGRKLVKNSREIGRSQVYYLWNSSRNGVETAEVRFKQITINGKGGSGCDVKTF